MPLGILRSVGVGETLGDDALAARYFEGDGPPGESTRRQPVMSCQTRGVRNPWADAACTASDLLKARYPYLP
jgi:hypothetical protein